MFKIINNKTGKVLVFNLDILEGTLIIYKDVSERNKKDFLAEKYKFKNEYNSYEEFKKDYKKYYMKSFWNTKTREKRLKRKENKNGSK